MTSQPEDKFVNLAAFQSVYNKVYEKTFGSPPPRGGEHSPSNDSGGTGTRRLEEGQVDSQDMDAQDSAHERGGKAEDSKREVVEDTRRSGDEGLSAAGRPEETEVGEETERSEIRQQSDTSLPRENPEQTASTRELESDSDTDSEDDPSDSNESQAESEPTSETPPHLPPGEHVISSLADVARLISQPSIKNVIILAGAGISTSAGIPDFRRPIPSPTSSSFKRKKLILPIFPACPARNSPETGLYHNLKRFDLPVPEAIFDINFFRRKPEPFYVLCKDLYPGKHLPTPTHYFFRLLEEKGKLLRIFTQNIDTLERIAGIPADKIVEAHGSFATSHCIQCRSELGEKEMRRAVEQGGGKPVRCEQCGGLVKPDIVFFGEGLPERFFERAARDLPKCDLLITLGTSLKVHPFASLVDQVPATCPRLLINRELVGEAMSKWDDGFRFKNGSRDWFYEGEADAGAMELARELGWETELEDMVETQQSELRRQWGLNQGGSKQSAETANSPEDTMDKLAKELEQAGI